MKKIIGIFILFLFIFEIPLTISKESPIENKIIIGNEKYQLFENIDYSKYGNFTITENGLIKTEDGWICYPPYPNYAPSGMPDFYVYQDDWRNENYNYSIGCYAYACANIVWYMDSKFSNASGFPGDGIDEFPLVRDYFAPGEPSPGPNTDDHNFNNVNDPLTPWDPENNIFGNELFETLRGYIDGYGYNFHSGLINFISDANLSKLLKVEDKRSPSLHDFLGYMEQEAVVAFIVGWYDMHNNRISGHFLSLAGVNINYSKIAVSDMNTNIENPINTDLQNDASIVSHDIYNIGKSPFNNNHLTINLYEPFQNTFVSIIDWLYAIVPNNPPLNPIINGHINGIINTEYTYNITCIEPDGDYFGIYIDWGDNTSTDWMGAYNSEINLSIKHIWSEQGQYIIRVIAKDKLGLESDWTTLEVSMPKTKDNDHLKTYLYRLIQRFPILESLL